MAFLLEYILKTQNRWPLQVIQNALSLLTHVPIRLFDLDRVNQIIPTSVEEAELQRWIEEDKFFENVTKNFPEFFRHRENSRWLTQPCNIHPFVERLRTNGWWLAWEHCFFWNWFNKNADGTWPVADYYRRCMKVSASLIDTKGTVDKNNNKRRWGVVVGPMFVPEPGQDSELPFKDMVHSFANDVVETFNRASQRALQQDNVGDYQTQKWGHISHDFSIDELAHLGGTRGWVTADCLKNKMQLIGNVINAIFSVSYNGQNSKNMSNSEYSSLAQIVLMLYRDLGSDTTGDLIEKLSDNHNLHFRIGLPNHRHDLEAVIQQDGWQLSIVESTENTRDKVWMTPAPVADSPEKRLLDQASYYRGEIGLAFANQYHGYTNQQLTKIARWMNTNLGLVSGHFNKKHDTGKDKEEPYKELCKKISQLFSADAVSIYLYKFDDKYSTVDRALVRETIWYQSRFRPHEMRKWAEADLVVMKEAARDTEKKKDSISYRAIRTRQARFLRDWHREENSVDFFDPEYEKALISKKDLLSPQENSGSEQGSTEEKFDGKSSMAVPFMIYNRPFGVLEIDGFHSHQFRFDSLLLAKQVAEIVGPFLYQKEVLHRLFKLTQVVLDEKASRQEKYQEICGAIADIFMADGVYLFRPLNHKPSKFRLMTSHKVHGADNLHESEPTGGLELEPVADSPFDPFDINNKSPEWAKQYKHRALVKEQFRWGVRIPVWHPTHRKEKLMRLTLFYKELRPFDDESHTAETELCALTRNWNPTVQFVASYLATLVTAMRTLSKDWSRTWINTHNKLNREADTLNRGLTDMQTATSNLLNCSETLKEVMGTLMEMEEYEY